MSDIPKISIIVPVYNVESYIRQCINTIISQTFINWELILIDDGSPDNSGKICDEYAVKDSRIKVVHKYNSGVGASRNLGIDISTGEYVVFVDSDDFCTESYLDNFIQGLIKYPKSDLIIQGLYLYDDKIISKRFFSESYYNNVVSAIIDNKLFSYGGPYCKLFKKEILQKYSIRFATNYSFGEDTIFFLRYLSHVQDLYFVSAVGYYYRDFQGNRLSKKCHHFINLYQFAVESMDLVKTLDKSNLLAKKYSYNYIRVLINGIIYSYKLGYSKSERCKVLQMVKDTGKDVIIYEGFDSCKFQYSLVCILPVSLLDCIVSIAFWLRQKFK